MLKSILSSSDCAACRFCCSFRRQSLWETPLFTEEAVARLEKMYPQAKFRLAAGDVVSSDCEGESYETGASCDGVTCKVAAANSRDTACEGATSEGTAHKGAAAASAHDKPAYTLDLSGNYKTDAPEEEALCPFLDASTGCVLPADLKPFDCSIWPFRAVEQADGTLAVALTPTCPAINKVPRKKVLALVERASTAQDTATAQPAGLGAKILAYAKEHPAIIKPQSAFLSDIVYKEQN